MSTETRTKFPAPSDQGGRRFEHAKEKAKGRWSSIMSSLWPECAPALNDAYIGRAVHVTCPRHGSSKKVGDGFRFYKDFHETGGGICNTCGGASNGIDLLAVMLDITPMTSLELVEGYLGINKNYVPVGRETPEVPKQPTEPKLSEEEIQERKARLTSIWSSGTPFSELPDDNLAMRYYVESRGIGSSDFMRLQTNLRYVPSLETYEGKSVQSFPGIVGLFESSTGRATGIHRTFLDRSQPVKAAITRPKSLLKKLELDTSGNQVILNGGVLIRSRRPLTAHQSVCEGIENAVSIAYAIGRPVIAATTGTLLGGWMPGQDVKAVTIWGDLDEVKRGVRAGWRYANELRHRLEGLGLKVRILFPSDKSGKTGEGRDWNDVLREDGVRALIEAYEDRDQQRQSA